MNNTQILKAIANLFEQETKQWTDNEKVATLEEVRAWATSKIINYEGEGNEQEQDELNDDEDK